MNLLYFHSVTQGKYQSSQEDTGGEITVFSDLVLLFNVTALSS